MKTTGENTRRAAVDETAAMWLAKRDRGLTEAEERDFAGWLAADPEHATAWGECEVGWVTLDAVRERGWGGELQRALAQRQHRRRLRRVTAALASCGVAAAVALTFFHSPPMPRGESVAAGAQVEEVAEAHRAAPRRRVLTDGSVITLQPEAQVEIAYAAGRRAVRLLRGEAQFEVAKDPSRPFIVSGGGVEVWAVGTAFSVHLGEHAVDLTVTEGKVAVNYAPSRASGELAPASEHLLVPAGNRLHVPSGGRALKELRVETLAAGAEGRSGAQALPVEFSDAPLREIVARLNRQSAVKLVIADASLEELRLSGVFPGADAETFARLLADHYDVSVERDGDRISLRRK